MQAKSVIYSMQKTRTYSAFPFSRKKIRENESKNVVQDSYAPLRKKILHIPINMAITSHSH